MFVVCCLLCVVRCSLLYTRHGECARSRHGGGLRTRQHCRGSHATGAILHQRWYQMPFQVGPLQMLPFAEQSERSLLLHSLGALFRSTRAPQRQHHLTSPELRSLCFLSSGFVGCASAMRSRITVCLSSASPALSQLSPPGGFAATLPTLAS